MAWEFEETPMFTKGFKKLPLEIQRRFKAQFEKVKKNPFGIGKPLSRPWIRELKNEMYRAYYVVYEDKLFILFAGVSDKKDQECVIRYIKSHFNHLRKSFGK